MVGSVVSVVGVPLLTGLELFGRGGTENLRAALTLIDSATELLLRANTRASDMWFSIGERAHEINASARVLGADEPLTVFEVTFPLVDDPPEIGPNCSAHLSTRQRRDLWYFNPNVDVARLFRTIDSRTAAALKAIHVMRNSAYHHGEVQEGAVGAVVAVQLECVSTLLRSMRVPIGERLVSRPDELERHDRIGLPTAFPFSLAGLADRLAEGFGVDRERTARVLSENLVERLARIDRGLAEAAAFLGGPLNLVSTEDAMRLVQLDMPWPDLETARRANVKWKPTVLAKWRAAIPGVRDARDAADSLLLFAEVDSPMAQLDDYLDRVLDQIDREVQMEIDLRRGK